MLRLAMFPLLTIITLLLIAIISFFLYRKIKKIIHSTYQKGAELANDQHKKWTKKEQRKKLPKLVQKGCDDYEVLSENLEQLTPEWKNAFKPLVTQAKEILDEVLADVMERTNGENSKKLSSIRSFFHHTLDAMSQFSKKLKDDHQHMSNDQIDIARQNLTLFKADLMRHKQTLNKGRKLDFDVLMDVIKARLKK